MRSLKAALLYADHVRLYNVGANILTTAKRSLGRGNVEQIDLMADLMEQFGQGDHAETLREMSPLIVGLLGHRGPLPPPMIAVKAKFAKMIRITKRAFSEGFGTFDGVSFPELDRAISSGKVTVHNFVGDISPDVLLTEYIKAIAEAADASRAFPMFDEHSADMLETGAEMGIVSPPQGGGAERRHAALAVELMDRLPVIDADVATVLDVRKDLRRHLDKFREAMVSYTSEVESEPWGKDFARDAKMVYIKTVGPAVQKIEEAVRSSRPLLKLVSASANPLPALGGSVLGVGLSHLGHVASTTAGIVGGAAVTAAKTLGEVLADREKIEANKLYFYYRAKKHPA
ncbi:hypothetical protein EON82_02150 [bacterium]|nr:MAG: hypothetical protein EON82_02150 [bacterium]